MRIGEVARQAEVSIQTLRFYEREGLLRTPDRSAAGYRRYERHDLERVLAIRQFQSVGFTLAEIGEVLDLHDALAAPGRAGYVRASARAIWLERAKARLTLVDKKVASLIAMKLELERLVDTLSGADEPVCTAAAAHTADPVECPWPGGHPNHPSNPASLGA